MAFLPRCSDGTATRGTMCKTDEWVFVLSLVLFLCSSCHYPLHLVEQVFPDDWLEASGEKLPVNAHHSVVDMVLQKFLHAGHGQRLAAYVAQSHVRKSLPK